MIKISGFDPGKLMEAHHLFPLKYAKYFMSKGINVNQFGAWWESTSHQANRILYNEAWGRYISTHADATIDDLFAEGFRLKQKFGF